MYNQPYFIPGYMRAMAAPTMMREMGAMRAPFMSTAANAGRGLGLIGRLGNGLSLFRTINWGGLITNASKTLGIVNQAIPLVRQVGPMVNNMKSMLRIASIFKDETDKPNNSNTNSNYQNTTKSNTYSSNQPKQSQLTNNTTTNNTTNNIRKEPSTQENNNSPTFFIPA